jgi:hypothetical protein
MVLPASRLLPSSGGRGRLTNKIATLLVNLQDNEQGLRAIVPLLTKIVEKAPDGEIWDAVYKLTTKSAPRVIPLGELTPPAELTPTTLTNSIPPGGFTTSLPRTSQPSHLHQTPTVQNTAGIVNSSEFRAHFDKELKMELGASLY